jgi:hypothetical protein
VYSGTYVREIGRDWIVQANDFAFMTVSKPIDRLDSRFHTLRDAARRRVHAGDYLKNSHFAGRAERRE